MLAGEVVDNLIPVRFYWVRRACWLKLYSEATEESHENLADDLHLPYFAWAIRPRFCGRDDGGGHGSRKERQTTPRYHARVTCVQSDARSTSTSRLSADYPLHLRPGDARIPVARAIRGGLP